MEFIVLIQAITNLMLSERVREVFEGENDLTKYLMILCSDEDLETSLAAAGALCILVSNSDKACTKVFETNSWLESFQWMLAQSQNDLQYRGVFILSILIRTICLRITIFEASFKGALCTLSSSDPNN